MRLPPLLVVGQQMRRERTGEASKTLTAKCPALATPPSVFFLSLHPIGDVRYSVT